MSHRPLFMSHRPLIAITAVPRIVPTGFGRRDADTAERGLVEGVVASGATPIVLPVIAPELAASQLRGVDGLVLSGGQDLDAVQFGAAPHPASTWIDPARDRHEVALWQAARSAGLPVLGICRGVQLAAAVSGGRVIPHIDGHDAGERFAEVRHQVTPTRDSELARALGTRPLSVNTIHHQAVCDAPEGWTIAARAADGTIEALELIDDGSWFLGVQWHPELMRDEPAGQAVFDLLAARLDAANA